MFGTSLPLYTVVQSRPLVWSTDARSTRLYGQFLVGPERNGLFVSVNLRLKVKNARLYGQNLGSPRVISSSLSSNAEHMPRYGYKFGFLRQFWMCQKSQVVVETPCMARSTDNFIPFQPFFRHSYCLITL